MFLIIISALRSDKSPVSFETCGVGDWVSTAVFFIIMLLFVVYASRRIGREQELKRKYGNVNLVESDLIFQGTVL